MSTNLRANLKFNNLQLEQKLTLILLLVFLAGIVISSSALSTLLHRSAQTQITSKALMLIQTMNSVRNYTSTKIKPELAEKLETKFLPESVPAYSAREVFESFRANKEYSNFFYKEATLNPTNPRDLADAFETKVVEGFRQSKELKTIQGFRSTEKGDIFYIARPLTVSKSSCLQCHGEPDMAPKTLIERYGTKAGFGWKLNEIVGAQIIFVPASKVLQNARQSFILTMGIVLGVFSLTIFLVNLWLRRSVVRPLRRMAQVAEVASKGDLSAEFQKLSNDEVGKLAEAFTRMKISFALAMKKLQQEKKKNRTQDKHGS